MVQGLLLTWILVQMSELLYRVSELFYRVSELFYGVSEIYPLVVRHVNIELIALMELLINYRIINRKQKCSQREDWEKNRYNRSCTKSLIETLYCSTCEVDIYLGLKQETVVIYLVQDVDFIPECHVSAIQDDI